MSDDESMAVVRRFFDLLNQAEFDLVTPLFAADFLLHFDGMPPLDATGAMGFFRGFIGAFPGIQHEIVDQFAAGDRVATRIVVTGVHTGDFMGMPPTGRSISIGAINIHRLAGGQVIEQWVNSDALGMLQQLGAIPADSDVTAPS
jgi:steroid delta-isomerase-like uncharacterized protein